MALNDIRNERIKKLDAFEKSGVDPYPAEVGAHRPIGEIIKKFSVLARGKKKITVAGRVMARREHGGSMFCDLKDESGKIQLFFKEDVLDKDEYKTFSETADVGDFVEVEGKAFKTKRGEPTIEITAWRMLAKSLLPLPDKWHGLQDVEERFRRRYLDLIMNDEVRNRFSLRSAMIASIRSFLEKENFQEVETPMLQPIAGGALARPFVTHHNALDADLYLRIAPELYLKRLLIGGFEKIYEIGRNFRNEGIDTTHNPEFTMLELYAAYWDEQDLMKFVEKMFAALCKATEKKYEITYQDAVIKCKAPFQRISFRNLLKKYALVVDYDSETRESLRLKAQRFGLEISAHEGKGKIADEIYKKICRPHVQEPTFVTEHPVDISPLAKKKEGVKDTVRRFQLVVGGLEIMNGFAELNDPREQRTRFEEQAGMRGAGENEAHPFDEDFVEAMEYGMPPAAGLGIGIDRLVMLLTDAKNIREVVLFPTLRSR
ncbi:lysine--tRNA ligase [Patescibacteria group bacterium]|nr:lysine--tRNA ligase [Patescibacteria group bacterium]